MLDSSNDPLMGVDRKMSNQADSTGCFYSNAMESYLSIMGRNHGYVASWRKSKWQNVQNAHQMSQSQRRRGKWLEDQTKQANECNWKSHYMTALNVTALSEKS
jgi:hypothetical protein